MIDGQTWPEQRDAALAKAKKRIAARRSKVLGNGGEFIVRARLIASGLRMVEQIHTGYRRIGDRWVPCGRVSGDWRAVAPGGRSVLVEAKTRSGDRLTYADLKPHQRAALDAHHEAGGLSLLALCHPTGVVLMAWPVEGFRRGSSLTIDEAKAQGWKP
jgi:hypothetical protein